MNEEIFIFSDASVSPQLNKAIGAFVVLDKSSIDLLSSFSSSDPSSIREEICGKIKYLEFETHKSTLAEMKTFLHIMKELNYLASKKIIFFTDCQSLCDLNGPRKSRLLANNFKKKNGSPLPHGKMYKEIISYFSSLTIDLIKIKGHNPSHKKESIADKIFSVVDKLARRRLRAEIISTN